MRYVRIIGFLGAFFFLFIGFVDAREVEVKVAIWRGRDEVVFSSASGLLVTLDQRTFSVPAGMPVRFSLRAGKVFWQEKGFTASRYVLAPRGSQPILWGKRPYRGVMMLETRGDELLLINRLPLEDYIKGTVKLEANPAWPEEALKAQIIVARTYALKNLGRHKEEGFDFCATVHCQRYGGINAEDPRSNALVEATRGMVLTYQGKLASVVYHSESGGCTDSAYNVWGREVPYLVSVPSPWEEGSPRACWTVVLRKEEIEERLRRAGYIPGALQGIEFVPDQNGRMKEVILFSRGEKWVIPASRFREAMGVDVLLSTYFTVTEEGGKERPMPVRENTLSVREENPSSPFGEETVSSRAFLQKEDWTLDDIIAFLELREKERERAKRVRPKIEEPVSASSSPAVEYNLGERFVFEGRGWGHGVGLSQWGAVGMAREGYDVRAILAHYFPGCEIGRMILK